MILKDMLLRHKRLYRRAAAKPAASKTPAARWALAAPVTWVGEVVLVLLEDEAVLALLEDEVAVLTEAGLEVDETLTTLTFNS